ncbi:MAG: CDP-alcohol phosphatidyltransferase family protein [Candidatus Saelkia tenebricola]|nr:CDP-alcohol phosphatidyltransferase family protein [Candidatus Saelkia tenebricola]
MNIANLCSCLRLLVLPFFIIAILYHSPQKEYLRLVAIFLAIFSFITDALDGFLARRKGLITNLGAFLDPLGDKLLLNAAFIILVLKPEFKDRLNLPMWVVVTVFLRDIFIALGSFILHAKSRLKISPSYLGKSAVVLQMAAIASALLYFPYTSVLWCITGVITVLAGVGYLLREGSKFYK